MSEAVSLSRFILQQQRKYPEAAGDFTLILEQIAFAAKIISREVNKAGLVNILGSVESKNVHGETQQKLDVYSNEQMVKALDPTGKVCAMASEEIEEMLPVSDKSLEGKYAVVFDPLDGSSNIDVNVSIGTIFGIYKRLDDNDCEKSLLQAGQSLVCAGYVIYGSSTMFVYTTGQGVNGFTLDPSIGEFLLSHPDIKIPEYGKIYSINESNYFRWPKGIQEYVNFIKQHPDRQYTLRWIGSLVADFHRNLLKGGVFLYPEDSKNKNGKLRLVYEANPMAFIVENAGGMATDGRQRILDIKPESLHQRVPLIIGSKYEVEKYLEFREKYG
ncbi:class 1 fructose-bisphosphatase [Hippea maritima]|uniref:Fructose-1,6-bisphosphatase class 1 n=1 Tax=Hippea maritima (strain ATCC 700847 / DSM 10411 / MH2) TaxID=760142 RepID=F2LTJ6_HIPMA|nr:class 1 fructose-bisphosphatase [Hippea maritima]AEA33321.1 Fructose-1,6-bisphosphatase class 1 [Hippea maritima DSM 10411]